LARLLIPKRTLFSRTNQQSFHGFDIPDSPAIRQFDYQLATRHYTVLSTSFLVVVPIASTIPNPVLESTLLSPLLNPPPVATHLMWVMVGSCWENQWAIDQFIRINFLGTGFF